VMQPLCAALKDKEMPVRACAAQALGQLRDVHVVLPLCMALKDEDQNVRESALVALGEIGDVRAVLPLCMALKDRIYKVRLFAAMVLGQIGDIATLPLRVLASSLTPVQKLITLQALKSARPIIGKKVVRYAIGDVEKYCTNLCRQGNASQ